ncbi:FprA family A-type flavoprotein [Thermohalobacter berrensis]|uniref:FprA family A-type flavoprotein n=1 Tax=Thermohalobacter berrensis TaxID=99594 RepID=UPI001FA9A0F9|nr:FprA family A-type flavoprotein [Thermohalobacter berrensis]
MEAVKVSENVYWVGVNDRKLELFENLWPLPYGVAYNSYIIDDEKVTLIDTVEEGQLNQYMKEIKEIIGDNRGIDYLIVNHMEPDHSGLIEALVKEFPNIKLVGNKKTIEMMESFFGITNNTYEVKEGDVIDLGKHRLKFYTTPMVHWPESMVAYEETEKMLFSSDAFGSFGTLDGGIFDDEVELDFFEGEMRRYYSNIVGKYGGAVQRAFTKLKDLDIKRICPSHGPIWRSYPEKVLELYDKWSKYEGEEGVVIVYGTMYGNTAKIAESIGRAITQKGIKNVKIYDASKTHSSFIISDIWKYKGLIIGSSTYDATLFPPVESLISKLQNKGIKNKIVGIFGTYGWSGGSLKKLKEFVNSIDCQLAYKPLDIKHSPNESAINECIKLAEDLVNRLRK